VERCSRGLNGDADPVETTFHLLVLTFCWKNVSLTIDRIEKLLTQYLKKELPKKKIFEYLLFSIIMIRF
jgi:hypothetical protein